MIWAAIIFAAAFWGPLYLVRRALKPRLPKQLAPTWAEVRARVAMENRCDALGAQAFKNWKHPILP